MIARYASLTGLRRLLANHKTNSIEHADKKTWKWSISRLKYVPEENSNFNAKIVALKYSPPIFKPKLEEI